MSASNLSGSVDQNRGSGNNASVNVIPRTLSPAGNKRRTMSPNTSQFVSEEKSNNMGSTSKKNTLENPDKSYDSARAPMLSPRPEHKDYNRYKYYSALRTGYAHLGIDQPELEPPSHVIDNALFLLNPFCK